MVNCTAEDFDAFVRQHPNGLVSQLAGYNEVMLTDGFTKSDFVAVADETGALVGGCAFYMKPLPRPFNCFYYALTKHAFTVDYENEALFAYLLEATKQKMRQLNVVLFSFDVPVSERNEGFYRRLEAMGCETKVFAEENSHNVFYRHNSRLDISDDLPAILKAMKGNTRRAIQKSLNFGFEIEKAGMERFDEFYEILELSAARDGFSLEKRERFRKKVEGILALEGSELWFVRFSGQKTKAYFESEKRKSEQVIEREEKKAKPNENRLREERSLLASIEERLAEMDELINRLPDGVVLSACLIGEAGQKNTYMYAGSTDEYRNYFPNYYMIYKLIEHSKAKGFKVLDLSGTQSDDKPGGLGSFKLSLGAETIAYSGDIYLVIMKPWGTIFKKLLQKRRNA